MQKGAILLYLIFYLLQRSMFTNEPFNAFFHRGMSAEQTHQ
jgi:hypothetical protein